MRDEDRVQAGGSPDGETRITDDGERGSTRRNLVIGGAVVAGGAVAASVGITSGASATTATGAAAAASGKRKRSTGKGAIGLTVNGRRHRIDAAPDTPLLYVLRDELGFKGPKFGCGLSQCGACAVLSDGKQIRSCVTPVIGVTKKHITTLEGLADSYHGTKTAPGEQPEKLHPLQQAWIDEQVPQCGYCQNGMLIEAADLLSKTPDPSEDQIIKAMDGHLCRCGTYNGIVRAIKRAAKEMH
jgi:aerobic-type carbon monoxide dehydrogenase small subunit (CoxS/CutS family)